MVWAPLQTLFHGPESNRATFRHWLAELSTTELPWHMSGHRKSRRGKGKTRRLALCILFGSAVLPLPRW